jgi:hypothetical protein
VTRRLSLAALGVSLFVVLATANSGGYRYGVSDQAFYLPAVQQHLDPALFPKDRTVLAAQAHLMQADELVAGVVKATGLSLETTAALLYLLTLIVCAGAAIAFGRSLALPWWGVAALLTAMTFRHRITKTGANSLEGYMHPRQMAFGLGVGAVACLLRDRHIAAIVCVLVAGVLHPTTALWFGLLIGVALLVRHRAWRLMGALAAVGLVGSGWLLTSGPFAARWVTMDPVWLQVLSEKDYLFPTEWPLDAWLINLAYPALIVWVWRRRVTAGTAGPAEGALVAGVAALVAVFLLSVPLTAARNAFAVQFQVTRVFWLLDLIAIAYVISTFAQRRRAIIAVTCALLLASIGRGYYLLEVLQEDRQLVTRSFPATPWTDAMAWIRAQDGQWHVLADPGHAWKYGVSVRLAAERDTVLESVKDSALAIYDRNVAARVAERAAALTDFDRLTTARAQRLDAQYHLDVVVVESAHVLDLPVLYRNTRFVVYDLR